MKKIALVIPSLNSGGAERVMSVLANEFAQDSELEVHLILYLKKDVFYNLDNRIIIHAPDFDYKDYPAWRYMQKVFFYLRNVLKQVKPMSLLSFGGRFNSFVLLSAYGLPINKFVSDRSKPGISYGKFQNKVNPVVYKHARGIVAQTSKARDYSVAKIKHNNILVIPNPVPFLHDPSIKREKIILNVGRFIASKQQLKLIEVFGKLNAAEWKLYLAGDGEYLDACKARVKELGLEDRVVFLGAVRNIADYFARASVFAFTSMSEGFPNALAEAMSSGCACISFDCIAGPSDIISDGENGFLIPVNDWTTYTAKLQELIDNEILRNTFSTTGLDWIKRFDQKAIALQYKEFLTNV